ncbi:MAG: hypothetical protein ACFFF4_08535 [Candidatus Thorarchaeota archaeon]
MNQEKLALLFALQEQPVAPAALLAKEVGVTPPTARTWLESLRKNKVYSSVQAVLRVRRIGLEMYDYLVRVEDYQSLKTIESFCDAHPYTSYRSRVFGGETRGLLLQFRQPVDVEKHLTKAFYKMMKAGIISDIRELPTLQTQYGSTHTKPRLDAWDPKNLTWKFDWEKWWNKAPVQKFDGFSETSLEEDQIDLDYIDTQLLQELTMDARRKNVDIIRAIRLNPDKKGIQQNVSSRLNRLKENVIETYSVFINWNHFDIYNTPMIIANSDSEKTRQLINHLKSTRDFPFSSNIRETKDGFVWIARLPSAHLSELVALVWKQAVSHELLIIDYKHSERYGLWAETFDKVRNEWRTDKEFCLDDAIEKIGL